LDSLFISPISFAFFSFSLVSHFHLVSFFNFPLLYSTLDNINGDESFKLFVSNRIP